MTPKYSFVRQDDVYLILLVGSSIEKEIRRVDKIFGEKESFMCAKIAINGFGRIGRLVLAAMAERGLLERSLMLLPP